MNGRASLPVSFGVCSISLQMYVKKLTPEASLAHYFQKKIWLLKAQKKMCLIIKHIQDYAFRITR